MKNRTIKSMVCSVKTEKCTDSLRYMLILNSTGKNHVVSSSFFKFMCPRFKLTLKSGNVASRLRRLINTQAMKTEETEEMKNSAIVE